MDNSVSVTRKIRKIRGKEDKREAGTVNFCKEDTAVSVPGESVACLEVFLVANPLLASYSLFDDSQRVRR